eukprot:6471986-Amphidinium_carterae.1
MVCRTVKMRHLPSVSVAMRSAHAQHSCRTHGRGLGKDWALFNFHLRGLYQNDSAKAMFEQVVPLRLSPPV